MSDNKDFKKWYIFDNKSEVAICKKCNTLVPYKGSNRVLQNHLKRFHVLNDISKTLVEGLSIRDIRNSEFLKKNLFSRGKKSEEVMSMIKHQYVIVKNIVIQEIGEEISKGAKFSVSLKSYCKTLNGLQKTYLSVNVHSTTSKVWNLGTLKPQHNLNKNNKLKASRGEENCANLSQKLKEFQLATTEDNKMVSITDDDDWNNSIINCLKMDPSKPIAFEYQLCYAQGLDLAVRDLLYNKNKLDGNEQLFNEKNGPLVYKIVEVLRSQVRRTQDPNERNKVNYWTKTYSNWNSVLEMMERSLTLKSQILKANAPECLTTAEFKDIQEIVLALKPIKTGIESLTRNDVTLLWAEGVLSFILDTLREQDTIFSRSLRESIQKRIKERRNKNLVGLFKFLNNPLTDDENKVNLDLPIPSAQHIREAGKKLFNRLYSGNLREEESAKQSKILEINRSKTNTIVDEKLKDAIKKAISIPIFEHHRNGINKEMTAFKLTGVRSCNLDRLFDALSTIRPTSFEAEDAFSEDGSFVIDTGTLLNDDEVNQLWFLRNYYRPKEQ